MENVRVKLSDYVQGLSEEAKSRCKQKISFYWWSRSLLDSFSNSLSEVESWPPVDSCDLVSYLVLKTSFLTIEQFRAHKGLDAYNQFVSGWVKDIKIWSVSDKYLTVARVSELSYTISH